MKLRLPAIFSRETKALNAVPHSRGWWTVFEPFAGAWQKNIEWKRKDILSYHAVFACVSLIASDISKLRIKLVQDSDGIWVEVPNREYTVINNPNPYQNRIQFIEFWMLSKLIRGNAYVLKVRNNRNEVIQLHVLNPDLVLPLVTDEGDVYYQLGSDNLAGITQVGITVPASEIIHDRFNCFYHPLVGLSPIYACGLPAFMGLKILENGSRHFQNGARPSGILTVPEAITKERAAELSDQWETKYGGENYGKVAILGGDIKYQALSMTAEESQLVELLGMTDTQICSTFHVPPYKIGVGQPPSYNNVQALNLEYYQSALQKHIEDIELLLDGGLRIPDARGMEFDLDGLLRMDSKSLIETLGAGVDKAIYAPNEARKRANMKPQDGGDVPFLQHQMWPINVLAERTIDDLRTQAPAQQADAAPANVDDAANDNAKLASEFIKRMRDG